MNLSSDAGINPIRPGLWNDVLTWGGGTEGHAIVKFQSCLGKTSTLRPFRGLTMVPLGSFLKTLGYL